MPTTGAAIEVRSFSLRAAKVSEDGTFSGYASTFGNVDRYGDVIDRGAFRKTLADRPSRPLLWGHDPREPIGIVDLSEDARGLRCNGRLELAVARAKEVYALMKAGAVRGLSIGFFPRQTEPAEGGGRIIREVELVEVSLTPFPANDGALVEEVRANSAARKENHVEIKQAIGELEGRIEQRLATLDQTVHEMRKQVDAIDARTQAAAAGLRWPGSSSGDFAYSIIRSFLEHRDAFLRHGRIAFETKAITSTSLTAPEPAGEIGRAGSPAYGAVRRLFRAVPITSGAVFVVREQGAAGWVASPQVEAALKSEANVTLTGEVLPVRTIAVWVAATRQALDDVEGLQAFVDSRLRWALEKAIEEQLLLGSGTGENLTGLYTQATTFNAALLASNWGLAEVLGAAATQVGLNGFAPSFAILHPADAFRLRFVRGSDQHYVSPPPLPAIIESATMAPGTFLVGDSTQAVIRMRQEATVEISTEHSDYFARNMVAIRAEERLALQIISPSAFVRGLLTTSPA